MLSEINYDMKAMFILAIVGIIVKLLMPSKNSETGTNNLAKANIWGYSITCIALFFMLFISFALTTNMYEVINYNSFEFIKELTIKSLPTILLISIISYVISLNMTYYDKINSNEVSKEYEIYSNISSVLIITQLVALLYYLVSNKYVMINYMLSVINLIVIGIMQIILKYFSTDG